MRNPMADNGENKVKDTQTETTITSRQHEKAKVHISVKLKGMLKHCSYTDHVLMLVYKMSSCCQPAVIKSLRNTGWSSYWWLMVSCGGFLNKRPMRYQYPSLTSL